MNLRALPLLFRLSLSRHTDNVVVAISSAWDLAKTRRHESVSPEHLLAGMVASGQNSPRSIFRRLRIVFDHQLVTDLAGPTRLENPVGRMDLDPAGREILTLARDQARTLGQNHVGTEHLLLALLNGPSRPASDFLRDHGLTSDSIRAFLCRSSA